jgi:mannose-6-phosphate isomerase-like protein (cupin superfamily)
MSIFHENIKTNTISNNNYRQVTYTGNHMQFVYMSIEPLDNIHLETHPNTDQFIRVESGIGQAIIDGIPYELGDDIGIIIPAGTQHKIVNVSTTYPLKLYSIYAPPEHPPNTINETNPDNAKKPDDSYERKYAKYKLKYLATKGK